MRFMTNLGKLMAICVVAVFSLVLLTSTTLPAMVAGQSSQDETADRVAKNKQYREQAQASLDNIVALREEIEEYEKQKENAISEEERQSLDAKINGNTEEIDQLEKRIKELETLNVALYAIEPALEAKIYSIVSELDAKYIYEDSPSYVGENPVQLVREDILTRSIVLVIDPDKVNSDGSNLPSEMSIDGVPIVLEFTKVEPLGCTPAARTGVCRPLKGGVSVAEQGSVSGGYIHSLGYKATRSGEVGFVMAGHSAVAKFKNIVQPHNDATKVVGVVQEHMYQQSGGFPYDFAWVKASSGISVENKIYGTTDAASYTVVGKTPDSSQMLGTFVYQSSASSGLRLGEISGNNPTKFYNTVHIFPNPGDSGSPIFIAFGSSVSLYGMTFLGAGGHSLYYPQDYIQAQIGAVPSTS
jgi:hypothetical protein